MSTITVPEGAAPGATLRVTTSNGPVDIVVPTGATPGTALPVPMPAQQPLIQQPFQQMMYRVQGDRQNATGAVVHTTSEEGGPMGGSYRAERVDALRGRHPGAVHGHGLLRPLLARR